MSTPSRPPKSSDFAGVRTVLFDLDGTLLDTLPDLAWALNEVLAATGRERLDDAHIRPSITHGARAMIVSAFGRDTPDDEVLRLRERFLALYRDNIARRTRLFPGMDAVLAEIEGRGLGWGVVTNKLARYTEPLVEALGIRARAACVVSGDTTPHSKPHPEPLLHAARLAGTDPRRCIYVGDAAKDVEAARGATMPVAVALWGYLAPEDDPAAWGADAALAAPAELVGWLDGTA